MGLFKCTTIVLLALIVTSCSKNITPGFYVNKEAVHDSFGSDLDRRYGYLKLNKDSSFMYEDVVIQYESEDVGATHLGYLGIGKYKIVKHDVILTFDRRFEFDKKAIADQRFITSDHAIIVGYFDFSQNLAHTSHETLTTRSIRFRYLIGPLKDGEISEELYK